MWITFRGTFYRDYQKDATPIATPYVCKYGRIWYNYYSTSKHTHKSKTAENIEIPTFSAVFIWSE